MRFGLHIAGAAGDFKGPRKQVAAKGGVMTPHHDGRPLPVIGEVLADGERFALHPDRAAHGCGDRGERAREYERPIDYHGVPRRDRRLTVKAEECVLHGAGVSCVGKQHRPSTGVACEPLRLVARGEAWYRGRFSLPWHVAQNRQACPFVLDRVDGAANIRADCDPQQLAFKHNGVHLMAPDMRPRMNCFWNST